MVASVIMLVGSILYNVWVFTGGSSPSTRNQVATAPGDIAPSPDAPSNPRGPLNPAEVHALRDVELDQRPEWPRNPFENLRQKPVEVVEVQEEEAPPPPAPAPPPDPVIASILYSSDRRAAMIDGHIVRIGDTLPAGKVVDILPKAVIVESFEHGRRTFEMKPPSSAGATK
jgi:hypothetical protein